MYESKTTPGKKFGSSFAGRKFDSYHAGEQPKVSADPATPRKEDAEPKDASVPKTEAAVHSDAPTNPQETVQAHGPAHEVSYTHNHATGEHTVSTEHPDGFKYQKVHSSTSDAFGDGKALAFEQGGDEWATSPKKREHPDQQGAESEEKNYEQPDLA